MKNGIRIVVHLVAISLLITAIVTAHKYCAALAFLIEISTWSLAPLAIMRTNRVHEIKKRTKMLREHG